MRCRGGLAEQAEHLPGADGDSGQQLLRASSTPTTAARRAPAGQHRTLTFKSTNAAGWYDLSFSSPLKLAAGNYWIGSITGASSNVAGFR